MHLWKTLKHELVYFYRLIPTWTSNCRARKFEPVWRNIGQRCHQRPCCAWDKHKHHSEVGWLVMRLLWSTAFKFNLFIFLILAEQQFSLFLTQAVQTIDHLLMSFSISSPQFLITHLWNLIVSTEKCIYCHWEWVQHSTCAFVGSAVSDTTLL